ncbi:hypothetical protein SESBI_13383 [Sesbania bispinosa]|nr:hypothetical protein SESBI_13383 [Sesbania bispinosa]
MVVEALEGYAYHGARDEELESWELENISRDEGLKIKNQYHCGGEETINWKEVKTERKIFPMDSARVERKVKEHVTTMEVWFLDQSTTIGTPQLDSTREVDVSLTMTELWILHMLARLPQPEFARSSGMEAERRKLNMAHTKVVATKGKEREGHDAFLT